MNVCRAQQGCEPWSSGQRYDYSFLKAIGRAEHTIDEFRSAVASYKKEHGLDEFFALLKRGGLHTDTAKVDTKVTIINELMAAVSNPTGTSLPSSTETSLPSSTGVSLNACRAMTQLRYIYEPYVTALVRQGLTNTSRIVGGTTARGRVGLPRS